jgi:hypothetical protein
MNDTWLAATTKDAERFEKELLEDMKFAVDRAISEAAKTPA